MKSGEGHSSAKRLAEQTCIQCGATYPAHTVRCEVDHVALPYWAGLVGQTIADRYVVQELLAVGGMAVVYQARQRIVNRLVALKVLRTRDSVADSERRSFLSEARVISRLRHPNIVQLYGQWLHVRPTDSE